MVRRLDDKFSLRYDSRINGLSLGHLVDGLPSAASFVFYFFINVFVYFLVISYVFPHVFLCFPMSYLRFLVFSYMTVE